MDDEAVELFEELALYFEDRMDINNEGGPNEAMQFHTAITRVLARWENERKRAASAGIIPL